jgi:YfiH family protein
MSVERVASSLIGSCAGVRHGFFTRRGGVSEGIYTSLNCGPGSADEAHRVAENRRRVTGAVGIAADALNTLSQIHSARVVCLEKALPAGRPVRADALVTTAPGLGLGVLAADCVPVLLARSGGGIIGAVHAGWKGALGGVVAATVETMASLGGPAEDLVACIGPAIQQRSYEVGEELRDRFVDADDANEIFFYNASRSEHYHLDLPGYVQGRLEAAGVGSVELLPLDTYADEECFFSYRRACHLNEPDYGRQVSVIAMTSDTE